jgi:preprotein translocase subunit SecD
MKSIRLVARVVAPLSLLALAACQTIPSQSGSQSSASATTPPSSAQTDSTQSQATSQQATQGAPVAVLLADSVEQTGWTAVNVGSGTLYVNPEPILTRADLVGVQSGASETGEGLLALDLSDQGQQKLQQSTTQFPNKRLALVVGSTLLAAPNYSTPVQTGQLVFVVGTEQNATAAARAIVGEDQAAPAATSPTTPAAPQQ